METRNRLRKSAGRRLFALLLSVVLLAGTLPVTLPTSAGIAGKTYTVPDLPDTGSVTTATDHFVSYSLTNLYGGKHPEFSSDGTKVTIRNGWHYTDLGEVCILTAQDIWPNTPANTSETTSEHCLDVRVEYEGAGGLTVYLVNFGKTTDSERWPGVPHPTKGLRNITVLGDNVSVYLVNSNIGYIEFRMAELADYKYPRFSAGMDSISGHDVPVSSQIIVSGFNSHVYMSAETNTDRKRADPIAVRVGVNYPIAQVSESNGITFANGAIYNPYDGILLGSGGGRMGKPDDYCTTVELANVNVSRLGTFTHTGNYAIGLYSETISNGCLEGLARVTVHNGAWYAPDTITLRDFSALTLSETDTVSYQTRQVYNETTQQYESEVYVDSFSPVAELKELSSMGIAGESNVYVQAMGYNTLRLSDAELKGNILVSEINTALTGDGYLDSAEIWNMNHQGRTGAKLQLLLGGNSTHITPSRSEGYTPNIMVDNTARLIVKDDPDEAGVGSLSVGQKDWDTGNYYCAAIGGTPSLDPKPHGVVSLVSGILSAWANSGSAAIGGSITRPIIVKDNENNIVTEQSVPGFSPDGGAVSVVGGVLNAYAAYGGAAIGGANGGNGGSFGMNGGTVNATATGFNEWGVPAAAVGGGAPKYKENDYSFLGFLVPPTNTSIGTTIYFKGGYTYESGGGGGSLIVYGGVLNATAENPEYAYQLKSQWSSEYMNLKLGILDPEYYEFYTVSSRTQSGGPIYDRLYSEDFPSTYYAKDGETVLDWEKIYNNGDGRTPGYVIGNSSSDDVVYSNMKNQLDIATVGGMLQSDGNPVVVLRQTDRYGSLDASWDRFHMEHHSRSIYDHTAQEWFQPSCIGRSVIFTIGYTGNAGGSGYEIQHNLYTYNTYRIHGQIDWPDLDYGGRILTLPEGTTLGLLSGSVMNVPEHLVIAAGDARQLTIEEGTVVQGKGRWPGKPADPENPPSYSQVKKLVEQMSTESGVTGVTHLGIGKVSGGQYAVIPGNSAEEVRSRAGGSGVELVTILNAGQWGFKKTDLGGDGENITKWSILNYEAGKTSVSLIENGALTATPGSYMTNNERFDVIVLDNNGALTVTLQSAKLSTPDYTVYEGQAGDLLTMDLNPKEKGVAFKINFDEDQVIQNKAVFSVPTFSGSEFKLESVAPLKDKCALRYGGSLKFTTPFADFAGISITELQINYGDKTTLGGIAADSHVEVPSIAGFPVKGNASVKLNTFSGKRLFSMNVELETPLFEGAFEVAFKEARGVVLPDTLYAEIGVDSGGIPLVPPTVIGYIQGGGLGISGLADTVNMDSFGAPPVRLKIAAKGSIIDVIDAWVRLSVGIDGFDLELSDIKIADAKFIKKFGASAKWYAGNQTIDGQEYWGFGTDMGAYLVVSVMLPGYEDPYGWDENDFNPFALISATGSVNFGGFTGYYIENRGNKKIAHFIYNLHASATLEGSLNIPKGIVGGFFPLKNVTLGKVQTGFYAAANTKTAVDGSKVSGSPSSVLNQLAQNASISFDAAIGAKVVIGTGRFKGNVRIVYVLGEKSVKISGGWGEGDSLDLSGAVNSTGVVGNEYATLAVIQDEETGDCVPVLLEGGFEKIASLDLGSGIAVQNVAETVSSVRGSKPEVVLSALPAGGTLNAQSDSADARKVKETPLGLGMTATVNTNNGYMLAFTLDEAYKDVVLGTGDVTIKKNGVAIDLVAPTYGAVTEAGYYGNPADNDAVNFDSEAGFFCFVPPSAGEYTIEINNNLATIDHVDAIKSSAFASLDETDTNLNLADNLANYKVNDANVSRKYKVQFVLGKEQGKSDYVLAEQELTGAAVYNGSLACSLTGSAAPSGDYYPSILLLEYVAATGQNGDSVATWTMVEQKEFAAVAYTNTEVPAGPASATLSYSGNGSMTAEWGAVAGATSYQVSVLEYTKEDGEPAKYTDTGLLFRTSDNSTSLVMDLSSLDAGKKYAVSVKAIIVTNSETGEYKNSAASPYSAPVEQKNATPPVITFSDNVLQGEGNQHTMTVGAAGGTIVLGGTAGLTVTVTNATYDGSTGNITIPAMVKNEPLSVRVLAVDETTGDYALEYITVIYDDTAPLLSLNGLGEFLLEQTENGFKTSVTGQTEAGAAVYVYKSNGDYIAGSAAAEDGSFVIPMQFAAKPGDTDLYVFAADKAGNKSDGMAVSFKDPDRMIRLDLNEGNAVCAADAFSIVDGGKAGNLPIPYTADCSKVFEGWYTDPEAGIPVADLTSFDGITTVYAHWSEAVVLTIQEGNQEIDSYPVRKGTPIGTLPEPKIPVDGKILTGWYTKKNIDGDIVEVPVGEDYVLNSNLTILPSWSTYATVTFDPGVGTCSVYEMKVPTDGTIDTYPVPDAAGYTFDGWYYTDPGAEETAANSATVYSADRVLTAHWKRNTSPLFVAMEDYEVTGEVGETLPDLQFTLPAGATGSPIVTYTGTGSTVYNGTAQPTEPGTYRVTVRSNTTESAYVGSADFTVRDGTAAKYAVSVDTGISNGTATVDKETAAKGTVVTVRLTADSGYWPEGVTVSDGDAAVAVTKVNNVTYTFTMPAKPVTVSASFQTLTQPEFRSKKAVLSGEIGIDFILAFPDGFDGTGAYMDFVLGDGRTGQMDYADAVVRTNGDRVFTCYINALELSETITATFHYGAGETVQATFAATEYLSYVGANAQDIVDGYEQQKKLFDLVTALQNYGYYLQGSGWTDNRPSHEAIAPAETGIAAQLTAVRDAVKAKAIHKEMGASGIPEENVFMSLTLNQDTVINIYILKSAGYTVDSATVNGTAHDVTEVTVGGVNYYRIKTDPLGAGALMQNQTVTVTAGNGEQAVLTVSAMSYVQAALNNPSFTTEEQCAVAALYKYALAAVAYSTPAP